MRALALKTPLIGINNRDLTQFTTNIGITMALKRHIPAERIVITESGICNAGIVAKMSAAGVGTYLIGGALMEADEPGAALASLFEGTLV